MTKNALRVLAASVLILATAGSAHAVILDPVLATTTRVTSSPAQSTLNVVLHNSNPTPLGGNLSAFVVGPNGVNQTVVVPRVEIPRGNSTLKILVPFEVSEVRWVRVSRLGFL